MITLIFYAVISAFRILVYGEPFDFFAFAIVGIVEITAELSSFLYWLFKGRYNTDETEVKPSVPHRPTAPHRPIAVKTVDMHSYRDNMLGKLSAEWTEVYGEMLELSAQLEGATRFGKQLEIERKIGHLKNRLEIIESRIKRLRGDDDE